MKNKKRMRVLCAVMLTVGMIPSSGKEILAAQGTEEVLENSTEGQQEVPERTRQETASEAAQETAEADENSETGENSETEEITEELVISDTEAETEEETEEVILGPEQNQQDPSPVISNIQQTIEHPVRSDLDTMVLPDTDWIAIDGVRATCTSYAKIQYGYQPEVQVGTIRYMSQLTGSGLFDWNYWGGWGNQAGIECGTASISMALSYVGVNLTPQQILDAHGGLTSFTGWGVTDLSPDVASGMEQYITGRGQYSPVIVHLPTYSELGHYVVLIGKVSDTDYLVLDCAQDSTWIMSMYSDFYYSIDQVYQYYNPNAPVLDHSAVIDMPVFANCTQMGKTAGSHCQVCGEVLTEQQVVPCNGHTWGDWATEELPTTEKAGRKSRSCIVCGQEEKRGIDPLPEELSVEIPEEFWLWKS